MLDPWAQPEIMLRKEKEKKNTMTKNETWQESYKWRNASEAE